MHKPPVPVDGVEFFPDTIENIGGKLVEIGRRRDFGIRRQPDLHLRSHLSVRIFVPVWLGVVYQWTRCAGLYPRPAAGAVPVDII